VNKCDDAGRGKLRKYKTNRNRLSIEKMYTFFCVTQERFMTVAQTERNEWKEERIMNPMNSIWQSIVSEEGDEKAQVHLMNLRVVLLIE
jgi:hypothetical protein